MRRFQAIATALALVAALALPASAQLGPPGGMIYAADRLFRTIGTPTELPEHGSFDTLYQLGGDLASVAEFAPGERGFRGGRWEVREVTFLSGSPIQFTNADQVKAAELAGQIAIGPVIRRFECPLIPARP